MNNILCVHWCLNCWYSKSNCLILNMCRNGFPPQGDSRTMIGIMMVMKTDTNRVALWPGFITQYPVDQYTELPYVWLTHWVRDKMAAIFQTTFSHAFSWMKMYKFRLRFHWSLFPRVQLAGAKPLSEPKMVSLLTHICVTRPQWVNSLRSSDAYMRQ